MKRSKLDPVQITQIEHDEDSKAKRVRIVQTEMAIELDHRDGDSVTSHPAKLAVSVRGVSEEDNGTDLVPAMDCSSIRGAKLFLDGSGEVEIMVSPVDSGDYFVEVLASQLVNLVARRIKIVSVDFVGDVHLVGRS